MIVAASLLGAFRMFFTPSGAKIKGTVIIEALLRRGYIKINVSCFDESEKNDIDISIDNISKWLVEQVAEQCDGNFRLKRARAGFSYVEIKMFNE